MRLSDHLALGRGGAGLLLRLPLLEPSFLLRSEQDRQTESSAGHGKSIREPTGAHLEDLPEDEPSFFFFLRPPLLGSRGVSNSGCAHPAPLRRRQPRLSTAA